MTWQRDLFFLLSWSYNRVFQVILETFFLNFSAKTNKQMLKRKKQPAVDVSAVKHSLCTRRAKRFVLSVTEVMFFSVILTKTKRQFGRNLWFPQSAWVLALQSFMVMLPPSCYFTTPAVYWPSVILLIMRFVLKPSGLAVINRLYCNVMNCYFRALSPGDKHLQKTHTHTRSNLIHTSKSVLKK